MGKCLKEQHAFCLIYSFREKIKLLLKTLVF